MSQKRILSVQAEEFINGVGFFFVLFLSDEAASLFI